MTDTDTIVRATYLSEDDRAYKRERAKRNRPKDPLPEIPDGPCCARCRSWFPPATHDDFGQCREVVVDPGASADKRLFIPRVEAERRFMFGVVHMPVRGFADACSLYRAKTDDEEVEPMKDDRVTTLRDLVRDRSDAA